MGSGMVRTLVVLAALCGAGVASGADTQIRLASGETLRVSIVELTETHLKCSHPVLGEFLIPRDQVVIVAPEAVGTSGEGGVTEGATEAGDRKSVV